MLQNKFSLAVAISFAAATLAACGGSGGSAGNQTPKIQFSSQVVFGDSLSDVGTYAVGGILALGGGRYTINSSINGAPAPTNWTELLASQLGLKAPCAAETGLQGTGPGFNVPITMHTPDCTNYAEGGAMVHSYIVPTPGGPMTVPADFGPGNANAPVGGSAVLGQLTVPLATQMQNHLAAHGGAYTGDEIVFVFAGGNDGIINTEVFAGTIQSVEQQALAGGATQDQAAAAAAAYAQSTAGPAAVQAMGVAGGTLAAYVNNYILAAGAKHVVVLNLPDLSTTPFGFYLESQLPGTQALIDTMVTTFNSQLAAGLTSPDVLLVDVHTVSVDQIVHPAQYGLTNVSATACNLNAPSNPLGSSLVCNASNVIPGDVSHYEFADSVHPTPYGNLLIARYVASKMAIKGWL